MAVIVLAVIFFGGNGGHKYTLVFQNAGQLVPDNQVLIGGSPAGTVESIGLTVAVILDATVVRIVLLPALMLLLGDRVWWLPKPLQRVIPKFSV